MLRPSGSAGAALQAARQRRFIFLFSEPIVAEVRDVLSRPRITRKYGVSADDVATVTDFMRAVGERIVPDIDIRDCRDPKDNAVLATAVTGSADVIVTTDDDLLVMHPYRTVTVIPPVTFLRQLAHESQ